MHGHEVRLNRSQLPLQLRCGRLRRLGTLRGIAQRALFGRAGLLRCGDIRFCVAQRALIGAAGLLCCGKARFCVGQRLLQRRRAPLLRCRALLCRLQRAVVQSSARLQLLEIRLRRSGTRAHMRRPGFQARRWDSHLDGGARVVALQLTDRLDLLLQRVPRRRPRRVQARELWRSLGQRTSRQRCTARRAGAPRSG